MDHFLRVSFTKISTATISRYLKQLQDKQIIQRVDSNKLGNWIILKIDK